MFLLAFKITYLCSVNLDAFNHLKIKIKHIIKNKCHRAYDMFTVYFYSSKSSYLRILD